MSNSITIKLLLPMFGFFLFAHSIGAKEVPHTNQPPLWVMEEEGNVDWFNSFLNMYARASLSAADIEGGAFDAATACDEILFLSQEFFPASSGISILRQFNDKNLSNLSRAEGFLVKKLLPSLNSMTDIIHEVSVNECGLQKNKKCCKSGGIKEKCKADPRRHCVIDWIGNCGSGSIMCPISSSVN